MDSNRDPYPQNFHFGFPDRGSVTALIIQLTVAGMLFRANWIESGGRVPCPATQQQQDPPPSLPIAIWAAILVDRWHLVCLLALASRS